MTDHSLRENTMLTSSVDVAAERDIKQKDVRHFESDTEKDNSTAKADFEAFQQWWAHMRQNRNRLRKKRHGHPATGGEGLSLADTIMAQRRVKDDLPLGTSATQLYREELHNRHKQAASSSRDGQTSASDSEASSSRVSEVTLRSRQRRKTKPATRSESLEDSSETSTEKSISTSRVAKNSHTSESSKVISQSRGKNSHNGVTAETPTAKTRHLDNDARNGHDTSKAAIVVGKHSTRAKNTPKTSEKLLVRTVERQKTAVIIENHNHHPVRTQSSDQYHFKSKEEGSSSTSHASLNKIDTSLSREMEKARSKNSPEAKYNRSHISEVPARQVPTAEILIANSMVDAQQHTVQRKTTNNHHNHVSQKDKSIDVTASKKKAAVDHHQKSIGRSSSEDKRSHSGYNNNRTEDIDASSIIDEDEDRLDTGYTSGNENTLQVVTGPDDSDNWKEDDDQQQQTPDHHQLGFVGESQRSMATNQAAAIAAAVITIDKSKPDQYHKPLASDRVKRKTDPVQQKGSITTNSPPLNKGGPLERTRNKKENTAEINGKPELTVNKNNNNTPELDRANLISWGDSSDDEEDGDNKEINNGTQGKSNNVPHPSSRLPAIETPPSNKKTSSSDKGRNSGRKTTATPKLPRIPPTAASEQRSASPWATKTELPEIPSHLTHLSNDYAPLRVSSLPEHSTNSMANNAQQQSRHHSGPSSRKKPNSDSPTGSSCNNKSKSSSSKVDVDQMEKQVDKVLGDIIEKYSHS